MTSNRHDGQRQSRRALTALIALLLILTLLVTAVACGKGKAEPTGESESAPGSGESQPTEPEGSQSTEPDEEKVKGYDFSLTDQYGVEHNLAQYEGKVVFLNFWATWCHNCIAEMPDIEQLYKDHGLNAGDLAVLGVAYPDDGSGAGQRELDLEGIKQFLTENDISFPVLMDLDGKIFQDYRIVGLPTTFIIDHEGYFIGYAQGAMQREIMDYYVEKAIEDMK